MDAQVNNTKTFFKKVKEHNDHQIYNDIKR